MNAIAAGGATSCPPFTHRHPRLMLALESRTRLLGTLNLAVALRGKSCGWGSCTRPRRTFIGHHRINVRHGPRYVRIHLDR